MPPERARADAREPFSGAASRCLYLLTLTRFLRAEILARWAGGAHAQTLAVQGHFSRAEGLERSYGLTTAQFRGRPAFTPASTPSRHRQPSRPGKPTTLGLERKAREVGPLKTERALGQREGKERVSRAFCSKTCEVRPSAIWFAGWGDRRNRDGYERPVERRIVSSENSRARKWRNWQTRRIQDPVG